MRHIPLTQGKFAIVDDADFEWLNQWKWHACRSGNTFYACRNTIQVRNVKRKTLLMHRAIMSTSQGRQIDHRNHDGLDNKRANLRECSRAENQHNQIATKAGTSEYKGVCRNKGKWLAYIRYNGKAIHIGYYATEQNAARAYNEKAKELFGKFACVNISA